MKKFIAIIISCSLALAAGAMAQQDETDAMPGKKKKRQQQQQEKARPAGDGQAQSKPEGARSPDRARGGMKAKEQRAERQNARAEAPANAAETAPAKAKGKGKGRAQMQAETSATDAGATTDVKAQTRQGRKGRDAAKASETATASETTTADSPDAARTKAQTRAEKRAQRQAQGQTAATTEAQSTQATAATGKVKGKAKPLDTETVKKIKTQHASFEAKPRPQQVPAVTFNESHTIRGADQWQGQNYVAFRSYRPQMHDENYYRSNYSRIELIGGGYYYFDAGYWYPAWGYQPSAQYYVYDGPIYAGRSAERLDRVIANVQAALQAQGYYRGEVDGLLGPLTREALTGYQSEHGLYTTAAIDEPTLNSLGMN